MDVSYCGVSTEKTMHHRLLEVSKGDMSLLFCALDVFHVSWCFMMFYNIGPIGFPKIKIWKYIKRIQTDWNREPLWIWDSLQVVAWGNHQLEGKDLVFCSQVFFGLSTPWTTKHSLGGWWRMYMFACFVWYPEEAPECFSNICSLHISLSCILDFFGE